MSSSLLVVAKNKEGKALATLESDDVVIFFNFRTDRGRGIIKGTFTKNI